ncbi:MAG TPA: hypothetical protein VLA53_05440, partial [Nitrosopumilaceae archaeon]|nr:hypothetical protein [Nitrosopumilaceae archaeon]
MVISQSLSNLDEQDFPKMQVQTTDVRLANFLAKKFRLSRSHATKKSYEIGLRKFMGFIENRFSFTLDRLVLQIKEKNVDPIQVLDDYYSYLSSFKRDGYSKAGYSRNTIKLYLTMAKEFLNSEGCRIYNEDIKQRFR